MNKGLPVSRTWDGAVSVEVFGAVQSEVVGVRGDMPVACLEEALDRRRRLCSCGIGCVSWGLI